MAEANWIGSGQKVRESEFTCSSQCWEGTVDSTLIWVGSPLKDLNRRMP